MENSMVIPQLKIDPAIPLMGLYPKQMKSGYEREMCTPRLLQQYS